LYLTVINSDKKGKTQMRKANKATLKYFTLFIILSLTLATTGCVSPMAINYKMQSLDTSKESIVLFTVRAANRLVPGNPLIVGNINVKATVSGKKFGFRVDEPISCNSFNWPEPCDHLISLKLPPNKYMISQILGRGQSVGTFFVDLKIDFDLEPNTIVYLGRIEMINRKRNKGEKRSGFILPILDQAMGGFAIGTIDISISDSYDEDVAIFRQYYPILKNYTVKKGIIKPEEENNGSTP
jgi:hypothetical protein